MNQLAMIAIICSTYNAKQTKYLQAIKDMGDNGATYFTVTLRRDYIYKSALYTQLYEDIYRSK